MTKLWETVRGWIIDKEPAMSAATLAAIGVLVDQVDQHGLSWQVLYAAIPLALGAAVRTVVTSRHTLDAARQ